MHGLTMEERAELRDLEAGYWRETDALKADTLNAIHDAETPEEYLHVMANYRRDMSAIKARYGEHK